MALSARPPRPVEVNIPQEEPVKTAFGGFNLPKAETPKVNTPSSTLDVQHSSEIFVSDGYGSLITPDGVEVPEIDTSNLGLPDSATYKDILYKALRDDNVIEIFINDEATFFVTTNRGEKFLIPAFRFDSIDDYHDFLDNELLSLSTQPLKPIGNNYLVECQIRLQTEERPVYARCHILTRPTVNAASVVTIAKMPRNHLSMSDLVSGGTLADPMATVISECIKVGGFNVVISGNTGSGKTTFMRALLPLVYEKTERIGVIEDLRELFVPRFDVVYLTTSPVIPGEEKSAVTMSYDMRQLMRMRVNSILIGECRGPEAKSFLRACNTGATKSMLTLHATSSKDTLEALTRFALEAGDSTSENMVRREVAGGVDLVVFLRKLANGKRVVAEVAEIGNTVNSNGTFQTNMLFQYDGAKGITVTKNAPSTFMVNKLRETGCTKTMGLFGLT